MDNAVRIYQVTEFKFPRSVEYLFVSEGKQQLFKMVRFSYLQWAPSSGLFNLGFGTYDYHTNQLLDRDTSGNGDAYVVFNTVLSTISMFFEHFPKASLVVQGSDSVEGFRDDCHRTCNRNCMDGCRKLDQRIRVYRNYLEKHFFELNKTYAFFGGQLSPYHMHSEAYLPGKSYKTIFLKKR